MTADTRLCALTHFYLDRGACLKVILMNAEASRRNLHYGIRTVGVKILMQSALTGVVIYPKLACRTGKALVGVVAY